MMKLTVSLSLLILSYVITIATAQQKACSIDLILLADNSGSIKENEMKDLKMFLKNIANGFKIGTSIDETQIGLVTFATSGIIRARLGESAAEVNAAIDKLHVTMGYTNTLAGLSEAQQLLSEPGKDRDDTHHPDVVLLITDGKPTVLADGTQIDDTDMSPETVIKRAQVQDDIIQKANEIRNRHGAKIITVGIKKATDANFLKKVADSPENFFSVQDFAVLGEKLAAITNDTCAPPKRETQGYFKAFSAGALILMRNRIPIAPAEISMSRCIECNLDLALAVDMSGSVGNYKDAVSQIKQFLSQAVTGLFMKQPHMHVALLRFVDKTQILVTLDDYSTDVIQNKINSLTVGGWTGTAEALWKVNNEVFTNEGGDRPDFPNILVLLTDGLPTRMLNGSRIGEAANPAQRLMVEQEVLDLATKLRNNGVIIIPVIIKGQKGTKFTLLKQLTDPAMTPVELDNFGDLLTQLTAIESKICTAPEKVAARKRQLLEEKDKILKEKLDIESLKAKLIRLLKEAEDTHE